MKISVVTVCYNSSCTIEETILSVLNQTYPNVEYIIIDGGSTDGTVDIIKKYAERIAYWISEPDKGIYDAMNKGIAAATGDYINFMNSGDMFASNDVLSSFKNFVSDDPEIIYGDVKLSYKGKELIKKPLPLCRIISMIPFCHQCTFVKTNELKSRPFNTAYCITADYDFFYNSYKDKKRFQYIPLLIAVYNATNGVSTDSLSESMHEKYKIWGIENNWMQKLPWQIDLLLYRIKYQIKKILPPTAVLNIKGFLHKLRT